MFNIPPRGAWLWFGLEEHLLIGNLIKFILFSKHSWKQLPFSLQLLGGGGVSEALLAGVSQVHWHSHQEMRTGSQLQHKMHSSSAFIPHYLTRKSFTVLSKIKNISYNSSHSFKKCQGRTGSFGIMKVYAVVSEEGYSVCKPLSVLEFLEIISLCHV